MNQIGVLDYPPPENISTECSTCQSGQQKVEQMSGINADWNGKSQLQRQIKRNTIYAYYVQFKIIVAVKFWC